MLVYPNINPVALHLGNFKIYWYGIMYLVSFLLIDFLAKHRINSVTNNSNNKLTIKTIEKSLNAALIGVLLGGRLGYVFFYGKGVAFFKIWEGGMSFHGGLIGVVLSIALVSHVEKYSLLELLDFWAPLVPIGLALGRLGNFINGELWGRITNVKWGMIYPHVDHFARHPSQIYEFLTEGLMLFLVLNFLRFFSFTKKRGVLSGIFLIGYGISRLICECFREPDIQIGYIYNCFTMGQLLTIPLLLIGIWILMRRNNE